MTILETVRLVGREFDDVSDETVNSIIELVSPMVSRKKFGKLYTQAVAYLVCHQLKTIGLGASSAFGSIDDAMRVASYSEGETSVSFSNPQSSAQQDGELALTLYGLKFIQLRRLVIIPITIA
ncbi:MAG: DUF4054 domain-containing protein [Oscillospiraceae bacterium]|nr:DUF4054 domain-containing protein [Oscillospiraceae bacterium]